MKLTNKDGFTLIELIIALALAVIMGGMLISLISSGGSLYNHSYDLQAAEKESKIAMSYTVMRIRQNDTSAGYAIYNKDEKGLYVKGLEGDMLQINIKDNKGVIIPAYKIFYEAGSLKEDIGGKVQTIADVRSVSFESINGSANGSSAGGGSIKITIGINHSTRDLTSEIALRSYFIYNH